MYKTVDEIAQLLDEKKPGWAAQIDITKLCLEERENDTCCVLRQLYNTYNNGLMSLFDEYPMWEQRIVFNDNYYLEEWKKAIASRV